MKIKKQKHGISLIVLVITIIIMIILASAVVISLNRSGMKAKSKDAVEKFDNKQLQELASIAWADAYADNVGKSTEELIPLLKESVEKALAENNLNKEDYGIYVTEKGVEIVKGWLQTEEETVVKGDTVLAIGDIVNYHDKANNGSEKYTGKWGVLGAENGNLLIMTYDNITSESITFNVDGTLDGALNDYLTLTDKIDEVCKPYGTGNGAVSARSITVDDILRIKASTLTYNSEINQKVVWYWDNTALNTVVLETLDGVQLSDALTVGDVFVWWDGNSFHKEKAPTTIPTEKQKICEVSMADEWLGYIESLDSDNISWILPARRNCIDSPGAGMSCSGEYPYYINTLFNEYGVIFYLAEMGNKTISGGLAITALDGGEYASNEILSSFRPVVEISSSVKLTGSSTSGWYIS